VRETQLRVAVRVRLRMFESFDSSVAMVAEEDFSISRRMVRLGVASGRRIVLMVVWRRCRIIVIDCTEGRCVRSGGVLRFSCDAA